jgi:PIN domain nuclease of toxin-antitoxin system
VSRFLLDTHAFLWSAGKSGRLKPAVASTLAGAAEVHTSVVVLWELCIKSGLGKLDLPMPLQDDPAGGFRAALSDLRLRLLPIELEHAAAVRNLPHHHRDPFDRMLIAQAIYEGLTLVTHDDVFDRYGLRTLKT